MVKKEYSSPQILATFCLWVLFIDAEKHNVSVFESLRVGDMSFFVFCKFEIAVFKIVQVMTENLPFAFLYVLSIFTLTPTFKKGPAIKYRKNPTFMEIPHFYSNFQNPSENSLNFPFKSMIAFSCTIKLHVML